MKDILQNSFELGIVVHTYNSTMWKAETAVSQVQSKPGIHR
jgi:hypothetical protein